jgi:putative transposase
MLALPTSLQILLLLLAGWINRQQQEVIAYLQEETRILRARLGDQSIRFTDSERSRLAIRAKTLGRQLLGELQTLVTPDTLLRWHRELVIRKWNYAQRRGPGRPRLVNDIAALILRMAQDNPTWGYTRIQGALANLGHEVGRGTVANVLKAHGLEPAPERSKHPSWAMFLKAHWECLAASDFFTVEVWTLTGLVTYYVLFVIEVATRSVQIAGVTTNPNTAWMMQTARNLTDVVDGFLLGKRYLILDRDTKYSDAFRSILVREGVKVIRLPPHSPDLNAYAERFVRSIKEECLNRLIFFGQASLRHAVREYMAHYHRERNHQGVGNRVLKPIPQTPQPRGGVERRQRLGGMLTYYYREAA